MDETMIKSVYHFLPMWVWEALIVLGMVSLYPIMVLLVVLIIGDWGEEENE